MRRGQREEKKEGEGEEGEEEDPTKCHRQNESSPRCRYLENEKRMIRIKHLRFVDGALRYSWNMKGAKLQMKITSNVQHFEHLKAAVFKAILTSPVSNGLW